MPKTLFLITSINLVTGTVTFSATVGNVISSTTYIFQTAKVLRIAYVPVRYTAYGIPICQPDSRRIGQAISLALKAYPTARIDYQNSGLALRVPLPNLTCDPIPLDDNRISKLLRDLTNVWPLMSPSPDYVFGWLPSGLLSGGGGRADVAWAGGAGKAALAYDYPNSRAVARVFTHETGHLLGRHHTNTVANLGDTNCQKNSNPKPPDYPGTDSEWKAFVDVLPSNDWYTQGFPNSTIQDYGVDLSRSNLVRPDSNYDYMSYCYNGNFDDVWTSPWTYSHIYSETLELPTVAAATLATPQPYLVVSGVIYTDTTASLDPSWIITSTATPFSPPVGTQYCLEAQNASGAALASQCFDLSFIDYETGAPSSQASFNLMLPYPTGIARIIVKKGASELAVRSVSASSPVVSILSPSSGETWSPTGTYTITWTANDADGDPLIYSVLYSPDGNNWMPVGTAITDTQLVVNATDLAGGGNAHIRVLASDGVNTTAADSAIFTVGRKGPQAFILAPDGDGTIPLGIPLLLQGYGYDPEDGTLGDSYLQWNSNRDGNLGTGSTLLASLSFGQHIITLTATDSDGNTSTASINVFIGSKTYLPLISR